jgi:hypothetical protein
MATYDEALQEATDLADGWVGPAHEVTRHMEGSYHGARCTCGWSAALGLKGWVTKQINGHLRNR